VIVCVCVCVCVHVYVCVRVCVFVCFLLVPVAEVPVAQERLDSPLSLFYGHTHVRV